MPIRVQCKCGANYSLPNESAGKIGTCRNCQAKFKIPLAEDVLAKEGPPPLPSQKGPPPIPVKRLPPPLPASISRPTKLPGERVTPSHPAKKSATSIAKPRKSKWILAVAAFVATGSALLYVGYFSWSGRSTAAAVQPGGTAEPEPKLPDASMPKQPDKKRQSESPAAFQLEIKEEPIDGDLLLTRPEIHVKLGHAFAKDDRLIALLTGRIGWKIGFSEGAFMPTEEDYKWVTQQTSLYDSLYGPRGIDHSQAIREFCKSYNEGKWKEKAFRQQFKAQGFMMLANEGSDLVEDDFKKNTFYAVLRELLDATAALHGEQQDKEGLKSALRKKFGGKPVSIMIGIADMRRAIDPGQNEHAEEWFFYHPEAKTYTFLDRFELLNPNVHRNLALSFVRSQRVQVAKFQTNKGVVALPLPDRLFVQPVISQFALNYASKQMLSVTFLSDESERIRELCKTEHYYIVLEVQGVTNFEDHCDVDKAKIVRACGSDRALKMIEIPSMSAPSGR